jgi:hypothetical protein
MISINHDQLNSLQDSRMRTLLVDIYHQLYGREVARVLFPQSRTSGDRPSKVAASPSGVGPASAGGGAPAVSMAGKPAAGIQLDDTIEDGEMLDDDEDGKVK